VFKQILIGYIEGAQNSYDKNFDALTFNANKFVNFYSRAEEKNLVIQGRALPFVDNDIVSLGYESSINSDFKITIDHEDGFFSKLDVFLEDKELNLLHNLKDDPYLFKTQTGTFNERFTLKFQDKSLKTKDFKPNQNIVLVSVKEKGIFIEAFDKIIDNVIIYDMSGKVIFKKDKIESSKLSIQNLISNDLVLLVKTTLKDGFEVTTKIIL
jgi:hypothetical protein